MVRIGPKRHRVELQSVSCTPDNMGGQTDVWTTEAKVAASIWPNTAAEMIRAGSLTMIGTSKIRIRHYPGILASWRVKFGTRYYSIISIVDFEERGREIELLCREIIA